MQLMKMVCKMLKSKSPNLEMSSPALEFLFLFFSPFIIKDDVIKPRSFDNEIKKSLPS